MLGRRSLVCVFGVSGVGKSTLISRYLAIRPDWIGLAASELLETRYSSADSPTSLEQDFVDQQIRLVERIKVVRQRSLKAHFIVDGHCALDVGGTLRVIPLVVIERLMPTLIVVVEDEVNAIGSRRTIDLTKERPLRNVRALTDLQQITVQLSQDYGRALRIPCERVCSGDLDTFALVLDNHVRHIGH